MTVQAVCEGEKLWKLEEKAEKYTFHKRSGVISLAEAAVLANNAESWEDRAGDPVETALLRMVFDTGTDIKKIRSQWRRIREQPFNPRQSR